MIVVLEGPDRTGKTTIANLIADACGATIEHMPHRDGSALRWYGTALDNYEGVPRIYDRFHWSEYVYGPILRNKHALTPEELRWLDMYLASRGAVVALLDDSTRHIRGRLQADDPDPKTIPATRRAFWKRLVRSEDVRTLYIRTRENTMEDNAGKIVRAAMQARTDAQTLVRLYPSYIGVPRPDVLLVGTRRTSLVHAGAFAPYPGTAAHHLMRCLPRHTRFGLVNATEVDVSALWVALGRPHMVALGCEAFDVLRSKDVGIPLGVAPHPQYAQREHGKDTRGYWHRLQRGLAGGGTATWK